MIMSLHNLVRRCAPLLVVIALAFGLGACSLVRVITHETTLDPVNLEAGNYEVDPSHISVSFKVDHFGFANYVGRFNKVSAALDYDPEAPADSVLNVSIEAASVDTLVELVTAQLKGPAFFDIESHPSLTFTSTLINLTSPTTAELTGNLTMAGNTHPVTLDVTFNGGGKNPLTQVDTLGFSATGQFKRSDFGIGAWIPAVGDDVTLDIEAEFVRRDAK